MPARDIPTKVIEIEALPSAAPRFRPPPERDFLGSSIPASDLVPVSAGTGDGPPAPTPESFKAPVLGRHELSWECREALQKFRRDNGPGGGELLSQGKTAEALGISSPLLGQLLSGKYNGIAETHEKKILAALSVRGMEVIVHVEPFRTVVSERLDTLVREALQTRMCRAVVGPQGCGKSASLDYLKASGSLSGSVHLLRARRALTASRRQIADQLRLAAGLHAPKKSENLYTKLAEHFAGKPVAIVLDHADEARADALQFLLSLHADCGVALVLIGRPAFALELKAGTYGPLPGGLRWQRISFDADSKARADRLEARRREIIDQLAAAHWSAGMVAPAVLEEVKALSYANKSADFASLVALWDAAKLRMVTAACAAAAGKGEPLPLADALRDAEVEVLARVATDRLMALAK